MEPARVEHITRVNVTTPYLLQYTIFCGDWRYSRYVTIWHTTFAFI